MAQSKATNRAAVAVIVVTAGAAIAYVLAIIKPNWASVSALKMVAGLLVAIEGGLLSYLTLSRSHMRGNRMLQAALLFSPDAAAIFFGIGFALGAFDGAKSLSRIFLGGAMACVFLGVLLAIASPIVRRQRARRELGG